MMMMNITPEKKGYQAKQEIKKTGEKIPTRDGDDAQGKSKCWNLSQKKILTIMLSILVTIIIITTVISIVYFVKSQTDETQIIFMEAGVMKTVLASGETFQSTSLMLQDKDKESLDLTINSIEQKKRLLQASFLQTLPKILSYFHKNTQISISIDDAFRIQIKIPGDTGLDFVIGDIDNQCLKSLQNLPIQLPITLKTVLEKLTGKKIDVSTCAAYDGVFNNETKDYTLLNEKKPYHPESFLKIRQNEKDLIGNKPIINNCKNITEISTKITSVISTLITNFKKTIFDNKDFFKIFMGLIEDKKSAKVAGSKSNEEIKRCTKIGKQLLRCCEDTWKSGELKVSNLNQAKPLQILQIIINAE